MRVAIVGAGPAGALAAGLFDFLILALHFHVALGQLLRLLLELLVGLLQLAFAGSAARPRVSATA